MTESIDLIKYKYNRLLFGFIIIFVLSLTNSIFINQIGYFGALFIVIILLFKKRITPQKNGLELAFIFFLAAEFISALLSVNKGEAFTILFKRMILIPIVYVMMFSLDNKEKTLSVFKIYLGAAIVTLTLYVVFAYEHFISQLYQYEMRGPSPFQYVMTAGGLMAFTTVYTFALFINEKPKLLIRVLYLALFLISSVALIASYTRAAWLGAITGIVVILIIKRKWWIIAPAALVIIGFFFLSKNESSVEKYSFGTEINKVGQINTEGRANNITSVADKMMIADHQNGLIILDDLTIVQTLETPAPAISSFGINDSLIVNYLMDSRFQFARIKDGKAKSLETVYSKGKTVDFKTINSSLFVLDIDSGLTVFEYTDSLRRFEFPQLTENSNFTADSNYFVVYNKKKQSLLLYENKYPVEFTLLDSLEYSTSVNLLWSFDGDYILQTDKELLVIGVENNTLSIKKSFNTTGIFRIQDYNNNLYGISFDGKFARIRDNEKEYEFSQLLQLQYSPSGFQFKDDYLYISHNKRNRLLSIFDKNHETNHERLQMWSTGFKILSDHPLFGVGDIDLKTIYSKYKEPYFKEDFGHLHNNYIHFLVILGVIGFIVVVYLLGSIIKLNIKIYSRLKNIPYASSYSLGTLAAFIGFLFSGIGEWNFGDQEIITLVWFTLGLNIAFYKNYSSELENGKKD